MDHVNLPTKRPLANVDVDEDAKPPAAKRSDGKEKEAASSSSAVLFSFDALSFVMEFLSPRQLYNVSLTCKSLRKLVTTEIVVKSALIHGGHARRTMEELYQLMSQHAIHVPSPLRLLRLANGKRCEFCCGEKVNFVRPGLGVFACWECTTGRGLTKAWKLTWARYRDHGEEYDKVFKYRRLAINIRGEKGYMWAVPRRKNLTREKIGPLATFQDVDRMYEYAKRGHSLDAYMKKALDAPAEDDYRAFNVSFQKTEERAKQVAKEREKKKEDSKERNKRNKIVKIDKMIIDLAEMLDEPYRAVALKKHELRHFRGAKISKLPVVRFEIPFVNELLEEYAVTPSKIRKKGLVEIAKTINSKLSLITEKRFLELRFLSEDDPFEAGIKDHFCETITDLESLLTQIRVRGYFFELLEKDQLISALSYFESDDLSFLLMKENDSAEKRTLVRTCWKWKLGEMTQSSTESHTNDNCLRSTFEACLTLISDAQIGLQKYITWLRDKYPEDEMRRSWASSDARSNGRSLPYLLKNDFNALDTCQDRGFESYVDWIRR